MLKLQNPYSVSAIDAKVKAAAPLVDAWLRANPQEKVVTLAELKAALPDIEADLKREVVNEICAQLGIVIVNPEEKDA